MMMMLLRELISIHILPTKYAINVENMQKHMQSFAIFCDILQKHIFQYFAILKSAKYISFGSSGEGWLRELGGKVGRRSTTTRSPHLDVELRGECGWV